MFESKAILSNLRFWLRIGASAPFLVIMPTVCAGAVFANFEAAQTNPIRISVDGTRLFAVNTPAATLSVFDLTQPEAPALIAEIPVGIGPVSVSPRGNDEAWVVNQVSDSVSVVSVSRGIVTGTLYVKDEPADVVFAGGMAFISVAQSNRIDVFGADTRSRITSLPVFGGSPRALAVSPDGGKVYATFALSGNGTTLIPKEFAPPQGPPVNPDLPSPPQVGLIVKADDPRWASSLRFTMPDNDVVVIDAAGTPAISNYFSGVGTVNLGLAVNPKTGDLFVSNTEARNTVRYEPVLRGHFVDNRITRVRPATGEITAFDLNPTIDYSVLPNTSALETALAQPTALVFDPSGSFMYVAAFGTDRIAVVDTEGNVLSRIEVAPPSAAGANIDPRNKRGPRGLALNAGAQKLYVLNRVSNTLSIVDTTRRTVLGEIGLGFDPTPPAIRAGRGFLYDAKLSGNGTGACAACHVDGDTDHLAWDLGDPGGSMSTATQWGLSIEFHPMKGPMTTQTLRGLRDMAPFHWRGDKQDFAAFNVAFESLMGGSQLSTADMTAFADFIDTLLFQPNPNQTLDRGFPASIAGGDPAAGQRHFIDLPLSDPGAAPGPRTCNSCHLATPGPGSNRIIDFVDFSQPLKNPHLRNIYQKLRFNSLGPETIDGFGLDHDGRLPGLAAFFRGRAFAAYSQMQKRDMIAFLLCFDTGTAPAVGFSGTLVAANVAHPLAQRNWLVLQEQASVGNIDLIARGTVNGEVHGLLYQPSTGTYLAEVNGLGPFTRTQLQALIEAGDTLTFIGVYPGSGTATRR